MKTGWAHKRAKALTEIAETQGKAGHAEDAKTTLKKAFVSAISIEDVKLRVGQLGKVATSQIFAGDVEGARVTIDMIIAHIKSIKNAELLKRIVSKSSHYIGFINIAETDQLDEFLKVIDSLDIEDQSKRQFARWAVGHSVRAAYLSESGPGAMAAVTRASSRVHEELKKAYLRSIEKDNILAILASSHADAQQFTEALDTAKMIDGAGDRIKSFAEIALAQKKAGEIEDAMATFGMAERLIWKKSDDINSWDLIEVAEVQIEADLVSDARTNFRRALKAAKSDYAWKQLVSLRRLLNGLLLIDDAVHR